MESKSIVNQVARSGGGGARVDGEEKVGQGEKRAPSE